MAEQNKKGGLMSKAIGVALCKFRGMLVTMDVVLHATNNGMSVGCPECGCNSFQKQGSWISCDCGFAISAVSFDRIASQLESE